MDLFVVAVISSLVWLILMLPYIFWLRRTTFYNAQRAYLLAAIVTGPVIGLIKVFGGHIATSFTAYGILETIVIPADAGLFRVANDTMAINGWFHHLSITPYLPLIYFTVMVILAAILIYRVSELWQVVRSNLITRNGDMTIVESPESHTPYSFFNLIFFSTSDRPSGQSLHTILKHEAVHTRQLHSLDIMLAEILLIFTWFMPVIIWYKKQLVLLHEFIADDLVLREIDRQTYGLLLIEQQMGVGRKLTHNFAGNALKKRFLKMTQRKSHAFHLAGFLILFPLAAICLNGALALDIDQLGVREKATINPSVQGQREVYLTPSGEITIVSKNTLDDKAMVIPRYPGGNDALIHYITEHLEVSASTRAGKPFRVMSRLNFDASGKLILVTLLQKTDPQLEESIRKVFNEMPDWLAPIINGKPVPSEIIIPISFNG